MVRTGRVAALTGALLALAGCGGRSQGAEAIQKFLAAVHADDRARFESVIDRPAVRSDLREQLMDVGRTAGVEVDGGASDFALDRMISPNAVKLLDARTGQPLAAAPTAAQVKALTRFSDARHACVGQASPTASCPLAFARKKGHWRLVAMRAGVITLSVDPAAKG